MASTVCVVLANIVVSALALRRNLGAEQVITVYFLELIVIFVFGLIRVFLYPFIEILPELKPSRFGMKWTVKDCIFGIIFYPFMVTLAILHLLPNVFLLVFVAIKFGAVSIGVGFMVFHAVMQDFSLLEIKSLLESAFGVLPYVLLSHLLYLIQDYKKFKSHSDGFLWSELFEPYIRAGYLFIVFIFAAIAHQYFSSITLSSLYLLVLMSLKTVLDVIDDRHVRRQRMSREGKTLGELSLRESL